jgi:hypothetical protein
MRSRIDVAHRKASGVADAVPRPGLLPQTGHAFSIKTSTVVGLRDRAIIAILIYTAARAGAVAALRRSNFHRAGEQWMLHFEEKGGKWTSWAARPAFTSSSRGGAEEFIRRGRLNQMEQNLFRMGMLLPHPMRPLQLLPSPPVSLGQPSPIQEW